MIRVRYIGWVGRQSTGDDACAEAVRHLIKQRTHQSFDFQAAEDFPADPRADLAICGGGTLLAAWADWNWTQRALKQVEAGVPLVLWGTGIHDPAFGWEGARHAPEGIEQLRQVIEAAQLIGLRSPISIQYLQNDGIDTSRCRVIGDAALALEDLGNAVDVAQAERFFPIGNEVGLCVGRAIGGLYGEEESFVGELVELTRKLSKSEDRVVLIPLCREDVEVVAHIHGTVAQPNVQAFRNIYDGVSLMNFLAKLRLVIAQKLHAQVLAAAVGTPFVTIAYRPECIDFAQSVGQERYVVKSDGPFSDGVLELVGALETQGSVACRALVSQVSGLKSAAGVFADEVVALTGIAIG